MDFVTWLSLLIAIIALARANWLAERVRALEARPTSGTPPSPVLLESPALSGLRIALDVSQDCPQPVVENLLREALLVEDALVVRPEDEPDLIIMGEVVGNGYSEVYYKADLVVHLGSVILCGVSQRPPQGDRPANLVKELVATLESEYAKHQTRGERSQAIQELGL